MQQELDLMKPISFSQDMMQALMEGRKTKTRRICKDEDGTYSGCRYGEPGEVMWVREEWGVDPVIDNNFDAALVGKLVDGVQAENMPTMEQWKDLIKYRADHNIFRVNQKWRPAAEMPFFASRMLLKIVDIKFERLQEITEEDAVLEGFEAVPDAFGAVDAFEQYWRDMYGSNGWNENPFVWVIEFEVID